MLFVETLKAQIKMVAASTKPAPADTAAALARSLLKVLDLHVPGPAGWQKARCEACGTEYPCATVVAIMRASK